jgi:YD repeat-containing protein
MLVASASGQSGDYMAGLPQFSTQDGGVYDKVDLATGRIFISIPIRTKVGKSSFSFALFGNFYVLGNNAVAPNTPAYRYVASMKGSLLGSPLDATVGYGYVPVGSCGDGSTQITITDGMGSNHAVNSFATCPAPLYGTEDNSGYRAVIPNDGSHLVYAGQGAQILDSSLSMKTEQTQLLPPQYGTSYEVLNRTVADLDGTQMTEVFNPPLSDYNPPSTRTYTDTLGQTVLTYTPGIPAPTVTDTYAYTDANNASQTVTVTYLHTYQDKPTLVTLSTGEQYTFAYDSLGRLASFTLPNGGSISYVHSPGLLPSGTDFYMDRTVTDKAGHSAKWHYAWQGGLEGTPPGTPTVFFFFYTVVTDPFMNDTQYWFNNSYQVYKITYQGSVASGTPLTTDISCYADSHTSIVSFQDCSTKPAPYPAQTAPTGWVRGRQTFHFVGSVSSPAFSPSSDSEYFDGLGNSLGTGRYQVSYPTGTSTRGTYSTNTYLGRAPTCGGSGILYPIASNILCETATREYGTNVVLGDVKYTRDSLGHTIQRDTLVQGTTYLTAYASYNSNGTLATTADVNGAVTKYFYDGPGGCNNLLLTSTTFPNGLSTKQTWDCIGGVVTSSTDANLKVSYYSYLDKNGKADPLWRIRSYTDALGNVTYGSYIPASSTTPASMEGSLVFNAGASTVDVLSTLDSLGRPYLSQTRHGPTSTTFDTVVRGYDDIGRLATLASPCSALKSTPCTASTPQVTYDPLGRPLQVTDAAGGFVSYKYFDGTAGINDILITVGPAPSSELSR